jgi:membrane protein
MQALSRPAEIAVIIKKTIAAWLAHDSSSKGAAMAFYTLFAIAPILVIVIGIASSFLGRNVAQANVQGELRALIGPNGATAVQALVASANYHLRSGLAEAIGIVVLLVGASSVFAELQAALDRIWEIPESSAAERWWDFLRARALSFGMVFGVGLLLLLSLIATTMLNVFSRWLGGFIEEWHAVLAALDALLSFGVTTLLFALIYRFVPRAKITWGDVWIGGAVTATLFTIGNAAIGLYLGRASLLSAYGAAGSFVVLLLWVYYSAQIFLLGAEFTCVFAYRHGSRHGMAAAERTASRQAAAAPSAQRTGA